MYLVCALKLVKKDERLRIERRAGNGFLSQQKGRKRKCERMKYVGIYWPLFAPMIKRVSGQDLARLLAERSIREGKRNTEGFCPVRTISAQAIPWRPTRILLTYLQRPWSERLNDHAGRNGACHDRRAESRLLWTVFGMTDLNRQPRKWYRDMKKYEAWFTKRGKDYPVNWNVCFDESRHKDGSFYFFTRCPICEFCERDGIAELMPVCVRRMKSCSAAAREAVSGTHDRKRRSPSATIGSSETDQIAAMTIRVKAIMATIFISCSKLRKNHLSHIPKDRRLFRLLA